MDADGGNQLSPRRRDTPSRSERRQLDGEIVDWLNGVDGMVLMSRSYVPEKSTGKITARIEEGLGVARIDTRTGKAALLEKPGDDVVDYISDGLGNIRIMTTTGAGCSGNLRGVDTHSYRLVNDRSWRELGKVTAGNGVRA